MDKNRLALKVIKKLKLIETALFRNLKQSEEALNNIAKHSKADLVCLSPRKPNGRIELSIEDNGLGFDLKEVLSTESSKRGLGVSSMKERTELSGGAFSVESIKGRGSVVRASWPYQGQGLSVDQPPLPVRPSLLEGGFFC